MSVEDLTMKVFRLQLQNRTLKHSSDMYLAIKVVKDQKATKVQLQRTVVDLRRELKEMEAKLKSTEESIATQEVGPILFALDPAKPPAPTTVAGFLYQLKMAAFGMKSLEAVQEILRR